MWLFLSSLLFKSLNKSGDGVANFDFVSACNSSCKTENAKKKQTAAWYSVEVYISTRLCSTSVVRKHARNAGTAGKTLLIMRLGLSTLTFLCFRITPSFKTDAKQWVLVQCKNGLTTQHQTDVDKSLFALSGPNFYKCVHPRSVLYNRCL